MAASNPVQGLKYLQNDMKEVVDLSNPQEREEVSSSPVLLHENITKICGREDGFV